VLGYDRNKLTALTLGYRLTVSVRLRLVPEVMVARMHGAMRAASAGQSPLRWREQFGPLPPAEALAWAYTTWLLADLLDYLGQERGQQDRFSDRVVEMLLTVNPDQDGGV
jgi:hypothetical protein